MSNKIIKYLKYNFMIFSYYFNKYKYGILMDVFNNK